MGLKEIEERVVFHNLSDGPGLIRSYLEGIETEWETEDDRLTLDSME